MHGEKRETDGGRDSRERNGTDPAIYESGVYIFSGWRHTSESTERLLRNFTMTEKEEVEKEEHYRVTMMEVPGEGKKGCGRLDE